MANKKTVEEALRQAEEKYRNIYENAIEGIFQTSPEGRFISANPALARILGYDSPEELMEGVRDVAKQVYIREGQRQEYVRLMEAEGLARNFEAEVCCRDGSVRWVSLNARAVHNAEGSVIHEQYATERKAPQKKNQIAVRLGEGQFLHQHVPMAQAPADILAAQLDDDNSRRLREDILVRLAAVGGSFRPVLLDGANHLLRPCRIAVPMRDHHYRVRPVGKSRQPVPAARQPLDPARRLGA